MTEYLSLPDEIQEVINEFEDMHNEIEDAVGGLTVNRTLCLGVCH